MRTRNTDYWMQYWGTGETDELSFLEQEKQNPISSGVQDKWEVSK